MKNIDGMDLFLITTIICFTVIICVAMFTGNLEILFNN